LVELWIKEVFQKVQWVGGGVYDLLTRISCSLDLSHCSTSGVAFTYVWSTTLSRFLHSMVATLKPMYLIRSWILVYSQPQSLFIRDQSRLLAVSVRRRWLSNFGNRASLGPPGEQGDWKAKMHSGVTVLAIDFQQLPKSQAPIAVQLPRIGTRKYQVDGVESLPN
jgi:hypothetical protein